MMEETTCSSLFLHKHFLCSQKSGYYRLVCLRCAVHVAGLFKHITSVVDANPGILVIRLYLAPPCPYVIAINSVPEISSNCSMFFVLSNSP